MSLIDPPKRNREQRSGAESGLAIDRVVEPRIRSRVVNVDYVALPQRGAGDAAIGRSANLVTACGEPAAKVVGQRLVDEDRETLAVEDA